MRRGAPPSPTRKNCGSLSPTPDTSCPPESFLAAKRPTILQIIPKLDTGGAELSTIEIAEAIERAGGRAIVLSEGGRLVQRLRDTGAELQFFPAAAKNPVRLWWNGRRIAEVMRRDGVDLIHARSRAPAWSALMAARRTRAAVRDDLSRRLQRALAVEAALQQRHGARRRRHRQLAVHGRPHPHALRHAAPPPARDLSRRRRALFDPAKVAAQRVNALRKEWGVEARRARHPAMPRGSPRWKGQSVLIEAVRLLREEGRLGSAVLVLAGDAQGRGGYQRQLEQEVQKGGARRAGAHRRPRRRHAGGVLRGARRRRRLDRAGGLRPHRGGGADDGHARHRDRHRRAAGDSAEASRVGAGEATGWLVPPNNAERLAEALAAALALAPEARTAMGARAHAHVARSFSLEGMKQQTLAGLRRALGTHMASG